MQAKWMLTRVIFLVCAINFVIIPAHAAYRISMSEAAERLSNSGYTIEDNIQLIGSNYEAIIYDPSNKRGVVDINATTGEVTFIRSLPQNRITWAEAAKILEDQGYTVASLEDKGDHYRATVYNSQNRAADMEVDKVTGKVIPHVIG